MGVMLLVQVEGRPGRAIPVNTPEFVIGRDPSCQLQIEEDTVSSRHCRIRLEGERVIVEDLNSRNGTVVNDRAVRVTDVRHGDLLRIGDSQFLFSIGAGEATGGTLLRGPLRVRLIVESGKVKGQAIEVNETVFTIGRDPSCQLRPNNPTISRKHALIERRDGRVFVRDLGTTNGTVLGDRVLRGEEFEAIDGDRVQLGPLSFSLSIETSGFDPNETATILPSGPQLLDGDADPDDNTTEIFSTLMMDAAPKAAEPSRNLLKNAPTAEAANLAKPPSSREIRPVEDGMLRLPQLKLGLAGDVLIVTLQSPYLDDSEATVGPVRYGLAAILEQGYPTRVVLNLEQVGSISRRAAGMLMAHAQRLYRAKGKMRLCRLSEQVRSELDEMSTQLNIETFETLDDAVRTPW